MKEKGRGWGRGKGSSKGRMRWVFACVGQQNAVPVACVVAVATAFRTKRRV
jgi:hypothetical protein